MSQDPSYYAARAQEEHRLANTSSDPRVRRAHLELAAEYAVRAGADGAHMLNDDVHVGRRSA
jgi:hypothetical protein